MSAAKPAFDNVLQLFRRPTPPPAKFRPQNASPAPSPASGAPLVPTEVNGFYTISSPTELTFHVTSNTAPRDQIGQGWTPVGLTGVKGQLRITSADLNLIPDPLTRLPGRRIKQISNTHSEPYIWSFTLQSDTDQTPPSYQYVTGASLFPPGQMKYSALKRQGPVFGEYDVKEHVMTLKFSEPPIDGFGPGWTVTNLPGYSQVFKVVSFSDLGTRKFHTVGADVETVHSQGAKVTQVANNGSAARGGVLKGDLIVAFEGVPVKSAENFNARIKSTKVGARVAVAITRAGAPITVNIVVEEATAYNEFAILAPVDGSIPENTSVPVRVKGDPASAREPNFSSEFTPGKFSQPPSDVDYGVIDTQILDNLKSPGAAPLRDLNTGLDASPEQPGPYVDASNLGLSTGSILSLFAIGPQENYTVSQDFPTSQWSPTFRRYTNSVLYQKTFQLNPTNGAFQNQTVQIELVPAEMGHLLSNMYLKVTMPALPSGYSYAPQLGRSLIKQVDLLVNETLIETIYDDWYIVRDQLFLDADEQIGMFQATGGATINSQVANDVIIPLEFFFCRRKSHSSGSERLRRPYFPLCAMLNQKLYVRITFQPNTWWCDVPTPHTTDLILPKLITEEILVEKEEKLYYTHTPLQYIVNRVKKESTLTFSAGNPQLQLTASFPVQTLAWFFRNKNYEDTTTGVYSDSRYSYGYTTQYIQTGIQLQFPSGPSNYVDVIDNAKITLNNIDILSTFQGSLYYTFKQPLEHGLSIPSKNIYTYSFGLSPKEYNQGGYLNFSKLNSQTTTLTLVFNPSYASQITQGYNLYLFYYGYTLLEFRDGFARLPFV
jgi:hypothetical protein